MLYGFLVVAVVEKLGSRSDITNLPTVMMKAVVRRAWTILNRVKEGLFESSMVQAAMVMEMVLEKVIVGCVLGHKYD